MSSVTLQIPLDSDFKTAAQLAATREGFSSLQEAIRVFLRKLISKRVTFSIGEQFPDEILTDRESKVLEKTYKEAMDAINNGVEGKDYFTAHSVDEMMQQLDSDR